MAKMFYTLEEAASKLNKSESEVREMASSGRLAEFRDRDKLMFKVEQVDLLIEDETEVTLDHPDMSGMIPLADSMGGDDLSLDDDLGSDLGLGASGSGEALNLGTGLGLETELDASGGASGTRSGMGSGIGLGESDAGHRTGVSIFDEDDLDTIDPAAATVMTSGGMDDLSLDSVGSGSGLLDLTRESDDTSLGAIDFLEEIGADEGGEEPISASGLFEGSGDEMEGAEAAGGMMAAAGGVGAMVAAEEYDGAGSGLVGGLAFGAIVSLALGVLIVVSGLMGAGGSGVSAMVADQFMPVVGGLAGLTLVAGAVGFFLGKRG